MAAEETVRGPDLRTMAMVLEEEIMAKREEEATATIMLKSAGVRNSIKTRKMKKGNLADDKEDASSVGTHLSSSHSRPEAGDKAFSRSWKRSSLNLSLMRKKSNKYHKTNADVKVDTSLQLPESWIQQADGYFFENFACLLPKQEAYSRSSVEDYNRLQRSSSQQLEEELLQTLQEDPVPALYPGLPRLQSLEVGDEWEVVQLADSARRVEKHRILPGADCSVDEDELEELYVETLYTVLHMLGCDVERVGKRPLVDYLQAVFQVEQARHELLLSIAEDKESPCVRLNMEVLSARNLIGKDINGKSDPFCTMYLSSSSQQQQKTSFKSETLNPVWNEFFSFEVQNIKEDCLHIEVWDFDPEQTPKEKIKRIKEVRSPQGLKRLFKETVNVSSGKPFHEFLGSKIIPLKNIPSNGSREWHKLEKPGKTRPRGDIELFLSLSSEKDHMVALKEHKFLLKLFLSHEIKKNKPGKFRWSGNLSQMAELILAQHAQLSELTEMDLTVLRWQVFTEKNQRKPLAFKAFLRILESLKKGLENGILTDDEEQQFWEVAEQFIRPCLEFVRKHRQHCSDASTDSFESLIHGLRCLAILSELQCSLMMNSHSKVVDRVIEALKQGNKDWVEYLLVNNQPDGQLQESRLKNAIRLTNLFMTDLKKGSEHFSNMFFRILQINYLPLSYQEFDTQLSELVQPLVSEVSQNLKPLEFSENKTNHLKETESLNMGTTLFELYLALQQFARFGASFSSTGVTSLQMQHFYKHFYKAMVQWLDIARYKAMQRIVRAVELDELIEIDSYVKHSSSAVDIISVFQQVVIFWKQLDWPDVEGSYTLVLKILDDVCSKSAIFYSEKMCDKVERNQNSWIKFEVTNQLCLAINNIDYVQQSIRPLARDLCLESVVENLRSLNGEEVARHCERTLQNVIDNALENVENKILEVLETVGKKMCPTIHKFLLDSSEMADMGKDNTNQLLEYLDDSLIKLKDRLNQKNFGRVLSIIWESSSHVLYKVIEQNIEKRKPPSFFRKLHNILKMLINFFYGDDQSKSSDETLQQMEKLISVHGTETLGLICQYYIERLGDQRQMETPVYGIVTVRAQFQGDNLHVEVLNARDLKPCDTNGLCDPYVKVYLIPEEKFTHCTKQKTKTHKRTLFPLFDEYFTFSVPRDYRTQEAAITFTVKDYDLIGKNDFCAEAFLPFYEIPHVGPESSLQQLEQVHLKLSRPKKDCEVLQILECRTWDRMARDFVRKQKNKLLE